MISDIEKFCYLESRLKEEAKDAISGILILQEYYGVNKTLLENRFDNTEVVLHHHIKDLIDSPQQLMQSSSDKLESHFTGA